MQLSGGEKLRCETTRLDPAQVDCFFCATASICFSDMEHASKVSRPTNCDKDLKLVALNMHHGNPVRGHLASTLCLFLSRV